ncbi:hypothetical protein IAT40_001463 [Kwoniella sp. CBS 6097]
MSQRQGRRSLGLAPLVSPNDGPTELQKFEDFRRKHSKQNKEIIMENINRKAIIKGLQNDIAVLHNELVEVRQANMVLQAQVKRMQREAGKMGDQHVRDALDQLITALPALRQLRDTLHVIQPISSQPHSQSSSSNRPSVLNPVENTYATRPAEMARQIHGLWDLAEGSEQESEVGEMERVLVRHTKGRSSESGSVSASRSPRRHTAKAYVEDNSSPLSSPAKSASPSPKKHSTGPRKQRRRRESGLLSLPQQVETRTRRSPSPLVQEGSRVADHEQTLKQELEQEQEQEQVDSEWEEGGALEIQPEEAAALVSAGDDISMPSDGVVLTSSVKETEVLDTIKEVTSSESGSGSSRTHGQSGLTELSDQALAEISNADEQAGLRGRRARGSVNYKEPSLNKKMRKPDGVSAEETLKPVSRKSAGSSSRPGTPKKGGDQDSSSSSPAPPVPPLPLDMVSVSAGLTSTTTSTSSSSSSFMAKATLARQSGVRRKSTLPTKSSMTRRKPSNYLEVEGSDDDDMDDLDDVIDLIDERLGRPSDDDEDLRDMEEKTASLRVASPAKRGKTASVDGLAIARPTAESASSRASISASASSSNIKAPLKSRTTSFRPTSSSADNAASIADPTLMNGSSTAQPTSASADGTSSASAKARSMASLGLGKGRPIMPSSSTARSLSDASSSSSGVGTGTRNFTPTGRVVSRGKNSSSDSGSGSLGEKQKERDVLAESDGPNQPPPCSTKLSSTDEIEIGKKATSSQEPKSTSADPASSLGSGLGAGPGLGSGLGLGPGLITVKERVVSRGRSVSGGTGGTTSRRRVSALT